MGLEPARGVELVSLLVRSSSMTSNEFISWQDIRWLVGAAAHVSQDMPDGISRSNPANTWVLDLHKFWQFYRMWIEEHWSEEMQSILIAELIRQA